MQPDEELRTAEANLLAALLQRVGYALWQAAECEDTLAHYVVVRLRSVKGIGEVAGLELLRQAQKRTFGSLLKELRGKGVVESDIDRRLVPLLEERNWLVHHAKRESRGALRDPPRFDALVSRLDRLAEEATSINSLLGARLEEFVIQAGADPSAIDREAAKLLSEWGYL
ncbi:MAG: hypothetical protein ABIP09_03935 [Gemmatimonadaceae bacterium]